MIRKSVLMPFILGSICSSHAMSQATPEITTSEWTQIREVSAKRENGLITIKGMVKNQEGVQTAILTIGELNSTLRQVCYDSIIKALDNSQKYQLTLTTTSPSSTYLITQSCSLALKNP